MSYNSSHYTPRYNSNSSRKLHEQAKKESTAGQPSFGASSSSNTSSSAAIGPTSRIREKGSTTTTSSSSGSGYGRRDYYIGAGYASSTASSRSRYSDSYILLKPSSGTGQNTSKPSSSIPSASTSTSSIHHGSSKDYRGIGDRSSSYYGGSSSLASRRSGAPPLHRYGSSSKYSLDATTGEKFISRAGPVTSTSGSTGSKIGSSANTTPISSGYRDERRSRAGVEDLNSNVYSTGEKDAELTSSRVSPPASEPFMSTTSRNLKGSLSRKSSVESVKKKSIDKSVSGRVSGASPSILDISRRDSARDEKRELNDREFSKKVTPPNDFISKNKHLDENRDPLAKKSNYEPISLTKNHGKPSSLEHKEHEGNKQELSSKTDTVKLKKEFEQVDDKTNVTVDAKTTIQNVDEKTSTTLKDSVRKETNSDSSKDLQREQPASTESKLSEPQSLPPSSSSSSSLSSSSFSTSTGMKKTSLSDYLKKSKVNKKAIESANKLDGAPNGEDKADSIEHEDNASESKAIEESIESKIDRGGFVSTSPTRDTTPVVAKEHLDLDELKIEDHVLEEARKSSEIIVDREDTKVTRQKEQVDAEMKDAVEEIEDSLLKSQSNDVENKIIEKVIQQTPEPSTSIKIEETANTHAFQSCNDKNKEAADKNEILMTPRTKLSRSDSYTEDISTLSPVNESELDANFSFNDIGTMPEIPEENETASKETKDLETVLNEVAQYASDKKIDKIENKHCNPHEAVHDEDDLSEAETIIGTPPPRLNQGVNLLKKKPHDRDRHNLKKKKMVISSSDEENNAEEEANTPKLDHHKANDSEDTRKVSTPEPKSTTFSESKDKKFVTGKAIKKPPYKIKRDSSGRSLLQRACKKGNLEDVRDYLNRGASANEKDFCGFTCLHEAALEGHNEIVQILIDYGANVNAKADEAGDCETPLIDAAENMHLETVEILLKNNADPTIFNIDGFTALTKIYNEHADEEGYEDIIKVLEDATNKFTSRKAIVTTSQQGPHEETEFEIIDDPNEFYFAGLIKRKGIFKWAAENQKEVVASHFVAGNSLEDKPDILIIAARNGHSELIDIILGLNPTPYNIDTESKCGVTALLASVGRGHFDVVQSLLSKGADPFKTRKKDGLTALQIVQHSPHFDPREVEIIQDAMEKKSGTKILSAVPSRIVSQVTSRATSRASSVPVSDDELDNEEEEGGELGERKDEAIVEKKIDGRVKSEEVEDNMDIDEISERAKDEELVKRVGIHDMKEKITKIINNDEETKKKKYDSEPLHHDHQNREQASETVVHDKDSKKRKPEYEPIQHEHLLKKAKSESLIKPIEKKLNRPTATAALKATPSDSTVPKLHNNTFEKSLSPTTVVPSHDNTTTDFKVKARSPSPPPVPSLSAAAIEEQKIRSAKEARIWQEKVEAKKKARREMFLKSEKEKELKKKEEEEKKLEEERELAEMKREQDLKLAQEMERKSKALDAKKAAITQKKLLDYYPVGLRKLKLNSKPTDASVAKYLPFYIFIINDVEYVLDLQISLLTLTRFNEFETELTPSENVPVITVESSDKVKLWKLFYKFIGTNHKLTNIAEIIKFRKQGEQLFDNLLLKFVPYNALKPIFEQKFPQVYHKVNELKPVVVLLDSLRGFDDLTNAMINENGKDLEEDEVDVEVNVKLLPRFIPPHLSYRKDIVKTVRATCNPLW